MNASRRGWGPGLHSPFPQRLEVRPVLARWQLRRLPDLFDGFGVVGEGLVEEVSLEAVEARPGVPDDAILVNGHKNRHAGGTHDTDWVVQDVPAEALPLG